MRAIHCSTRKCWQNRCYFLSLWKVKISCSLHALLNINSMSSFLQLDHNLESSLWHMHLYMIRQRTLLLPACLLQRWMEQTQPQKEQRNNKFSSDHCHSPSWLMGSALPLEDKFCWNISLWLDSKHYWIWAPGFFFSLHVIAAEVKMTDIVVLRMLRAKVKTPKPWTLVISWLKRYIEPQT